MDSARGRPVVRDAHPVGNRTLMPRCGRNQSGRSAAVPSVVSMATTVSPGLRTAATSVLDDQHDDQDEESDDDVDHRARRFSQGAPQSFKMTRTGPPDCWAMQQTAYAAAIRIDFIGRPAEQQSRAGRVERRATTGREPRQGIGAVELLASRDRSRCEDDARAPLRGDRLRQQPLGRLRAPPRRHHHQHAAEVRDDVDADDLRAARSCRNRSSRSRWTRSRRGSTW